MDAEDAFWANTESGRNPSQGQSLRYQGIPPSPRSQRDSSLSRPSSREASLGPNRGLASLPPPRSMSIPRRGDALRAEIAASLGSLLSPTHVESPQRMQPSPARLERREEEETPRLTTASEPSPTHQTDAQIDAEDEFWSKQPSSHVESRKSPLAASRMEERGRAFDREIQSLRSRSPILSPPPVPRTVLSAPPPTPPSFSSHAEVCVDLYMN